MKNEKRHKVRRKWGIKGGSGRGEYEYDQNALNAVVNFSKSFLKICSQGRPLEAKHHFCHILEFPNFQSHKPNKLLVSIHYTLVLILSQLRKSVSPEPPSCPVLSGGRLEG